jgi:sugar/nucleoside kinase (ribokinase family)
MVGIIAHAPVDVVAEGCDSLLAPYGLARAECTTIPVERSFALAAELARCARPPRYLPGGCGANMAAWLARLGSEVAVVAPFGNDSYAALARDDLESRGVEILGFAYDGPHSLIYTLITEDRERTFADYCHGVRYDLLDAARDLAREPIVSIDGYLLLRPGAADGVETYLAELRPARQQIVFCPGDVSVLKDAPSAMRIVERCDHLVMNRNEAHALFPGMTEAEAAAALRARGVSGAITMSEQGALLFNADELLHVPATGLARAIVNTNGAGDAFASGYVHGIDRGMDLAAIGRLATRCAAEILVTEAARPEPVEAAVA